MQKMCTKNLAWDPFFILANNPKQPLHGGFKKKKDIWKDDYQKPLKKLTWIFLSNPIPSNDVPYKQGFP